MVRDRFGVSKRRGLPGGVDQPHPGPQLSDDERELRDCLRAFRVSDPAGGWRRAARCELTPTEFANNHIKHDQAA